MIPVCPLLPPSTYRGGKRQLAQRIIGQIDAVPHKLYAEPFLGMGGVFLRRGKKPANEVVNDINRELVNFFRILQRHFAYFAQEIAFTPAARETFERLKAQPPELLTDLERAVRFFYLQRTAFGGKVCGQTYAADKKSCRFNSNKLQPLLERISQRMAGVNIECLPWRAFIERYDAPDTLFYLDPPYYGNEADYGKGIFSRADFIEMAKVLKGLQGRFILSLNDTPEVREIFGDYRIEQLACVYSCNQGNNAHAAREVLITNS